MRRPIIVAIVIFVVVALGALAYTLLTQSGKPKVPTLAFDLVEESKFDTIQSTSSGIIAVRKDGIFKLNESTRQFDKLGNVRTGDIRISNNGNYISSSNGTETIIYTAGLQVIKTVRSDFFGWIGNTGSFIFLQPSASTPGTDVIPETLQAVFLGNVANSGIAQVASTALPYAVLASSETEVLLACGVGENTAITKLNLPAKTSARVEELPNPNFARTGKAALAAIQNQTFTAAELIYLYQANGTKTNSGLVAGLGSTFVESEQAILQSSTNNTETTISSYNPASQSSNQLYKIPYIMPALQNFIKYQDMLVFNTANGVIVALLPGDPQ